MKITIRRITLKNFDHFFDFFKKTVSSEFKEYSKGDLNYIFSRGWSKKRYVSWLKNKDRFILGAFYKNKLVAVIDTEMPFLGVCFCSWLMVDKKLQNKGVGTKLLKELEKIMKKKGVHMMLLYADKHNIPYYKKVGYKWVGNINKSWFGQDHHVFVKHIQKPKEKNYLK